MSRTLRFPVILFALFLGSLLLFLWGAQQMPVTDPVESCYALTAKEMVTSGDWISPQIYGTYWYDKPALVYWLLSASYTVFGFSNFASRFPAALAGACSALLLAWYLYRISEDRAAAIWAGVLLATSLEFWLISHAVITDSLLLLFTIPTLLSAHIGIVEKNWLHIVIAYAAAGFACLAKGPVGLALPGLILLLWCCSRKSFRDVLRLFNPLGILVFLAVAAPWYVTMWNLHGVDFIDGFLGLHNIGRALSSEHPAENHFYYYLLVLPLSLLPWTGLSFYGMGKLWRERTTYYDFLMIWCWTTILFYTLVATKYITYTYIAVVPAILLAVLALPKILTEGNKKAQATLVIPFTLTMAALLAGTFYIDGNYMSFYVIAGYSVILLLTQWKKQQTGSMLLLTTASMAVTYLCLVLGGLPSYIATRSSVDMAEYFHALPGRHYFYKDYDASFTYYTGETATKIYAENEEQRDARWEGKYAMPTIQSSELLADAKGEEIYVFVSRGARKAFDKWEMKNQFTLDKEFVSGNIYKMRNS